MILPDGLYRWVTRQNSNLPLIGLITFGFPKFFMRSIYNANRGRALWNGRKACVTLSFDCDYPEDVEAIPAIVDMLKPYRYHASFAAVGYWVEKYPREHARALEYGHELMNHTYSHPDNELLNPGRKFRLIPRAEKVEGGWKVTGQKVWTSMAQVADWAILLVRTSGTGKGPDRHKGITYLLLDMTTPGVDVRPLRELTGHAAFNEVFLDGVFVPDDCLVGEVGGGWPLARTTLANERVAMSSGSPFGRGVEDVLADVEALGGFGGDQVLRDRVGHLVCEAHGQALLGFRTTLRQLSGAEPGPASSVRKLVGMRHQQDAAELRFELRGMQGLDLSDPGTAKLAHTMLNTRCLTIAGGTSEVLKNVVGERILGLPREDAR